MRVPFRRRAERPTMKSPDDVMTLTEHLGELRVRIIRSALAITIGAILIIAFYDQVLDFLLQPYLDLCASKGEDFCGFDASSGRSPAEHPRPRRGPLHPPARSPRYGGLILAMPVVLWQVWRFIVPALHAKEKRYAIPFILTSILLFLLGGLLAYLTLGKALEFLIAWSGDNVEAEFQVSKYIRLVGLMVGAFGDRLPVPDPARVPPARRRAHAADADQGLALRPDRDRRRRRRHHPVRRPHLAGSPWPCR